MAVSYTKTMRKAAEQKGTRLITIDTPCLCYQTPAATPEMVDELHVLFEKWTKERHAAALDPVAKFESLD